MKKFLIRIATLSTVTALLLTALAAPFAYAEGDMHIPAEWAQFEVRAADAVGILPAFANASSFADNITREEFCEIIVRTYEKANAKLAELPRTSPFSDTDNPYILKAAELKIVNGFDDGTFGPEKLLTRQEAAKMLCPVAFPQNTTQPSNFNPDNYIYFTDKEDVADWAAYPVYILNSNRIMSGNNNEFRPLDNLTRQEAMVLAVRALAKVNIKAFEDAGIYMTSRPAMWRSDLVAYQSGAQFSFDLAEPRDANGSLMFEFYNWGGYLLHETELPSSRYGGYSLDLSKIRPVYTEDGIVWELIENNIYDKLYGDGEGNVTVIARVIPKSSKGILSENVLTEQIELRPFVNLNEEMFGNPDRRGFESDAQARSYMKAVTVNVWNIDRNGNKVASTRSVTVNRAVADDVWKIFQEIFDDPEQFPIKEVGGYDWRGGSRTEHNLGTAIDLNPNENAFIAPDGRILAGSFYSPGENVYSIPPDGSVVRIFNKYGWWRGSWANGDDYMHFSLFGT